MWRGLGIGLVILSVLPFGGCARGTVQEALGIDKRAPDEFAVVKRAPLIIPPDYDLRPPDPGAPRPNIGTTSDQARVALTGSQDQPSTASRVLGGAAPAGANQGVPAATPPGMAASVQATAMADDLLSAGTRAPTNGTAASDATTAATANGAPATASSATASSAAGAQQAGVTEGEMVMVAMAGGDQADPDIRRTIAEENQTLADVEASLFTRIVKWREPSTLGATIDAPAEAQRLRDNKIAGRTPTEGDTPTVINRRQSALQGLMEDLF